MSIPEGLCQCGCGKPTRLSPYSDATRGYVKGKPYRFLPGHHRKLQLGQEWYEAPGPLPTPCHIWKGKPEGQGYGVITRGGVTHKAHRWRYLREVGPIPDGYTLDHLCRVKLCTNPEHMEPVSHRTNVLRGVGPTAANAAKTHCKHGHPLSGENLRINAKGQRICRECERRATRDKMRRKRSNPQQRAALNAYKRAWRDEQRRKGYEPT
jgi:hypothetical protein